ncbi:hypothetical protein CAPTEDRAFT_92248, partial [Capitella teleta]
SFFVQIDWEERWLWVLIASHLVCLAVTIASTAYKAHSFQMVLFFTLLGLIYCSEYINEWAAANYKLFANQQYFDSKGLFISLMFSFPLLLNCLVIVVGWMCNTMSLMVNVKRAKIRHEHAAMKEEEKKEK